MPAKYGTPPQPAGLQSGRWDSDSPELAAPQGRRPELALRERSEAGPAADSERLPTGASYSVTR